MSTTLVNKANQQNSNHQRGTLRMASRLGVHTGIPTAIAALLATACVEAPKDIESSAASEEAIINGYIARPFELRNNPVESKSVLDAGGCGGTLIDPEWVITAAHCPLSTVVLSRRPTGNVQRNVDWHVDNADTDARLLHLDRPFFDIPSALRYNSADEGMLNQSVSVYGWGGTETNGTCSADVPCPEGYGCFKGVCGKNNSGQLRFGDSLTVVRTETSCVDHGATMCFEYVANSLGQLTLFGDSGGPVFRDGALAGIVDYLGNGGTPNAVAGAVSLYKLRGWINDQLASVPQTFDKKVTLGTSPPVSQAGNGWRVNGTGDFDGDGHLDLVVRPANNNGEVHNLLMNADGTVKNTVVVAAVGPTWQIYGVGDFDADGRSDLVWRQANDTGEPRIWLMGPDGHTKPEGDVGLPVLQASWRIYGIGDFNGDGWSDLLVRPTNGLAGGEIWMQRDGAVLSKVALPLVGPEWQINGIGDFDGDGRSDLVWRRTDDSAEARIWLLHNGYAFADLPVPYNGWDGRGWRINGVGDFNGDGTSDLIWRRTSDSAEPQVWLIKSGKLVGGGGLPYVPSPWRIVGTGDFNGDRKADLVWNHMTDGADASLWLLNSAP